MFSNPLGNVHSTSFLRKGDAERFLLEVDPEFVSTWTLTDRQTGYENAVTWRRW